MGQNSKIEWTHHTFNPWMGCTKVDELCKFCYAERDMDQRWGKVKWGPNGTRVLSGESNWRKPITWNRWAEEGICHGCGGQGNIKRELCPVCNGAGFFYSKGVVTPYRARVFCASLADVWEYWDGPILRGGDVVKIGVPAKPGTMFFPPSSAEREIGLNEVRSRLFDLIDATPWLDWLLLTKRPENIARFAPDRWMMGQQGGMPRNVWLGFSAGTQKGLDERWQEMQAVATLLRPSVVFLSAEPLLEPLDLRKCFEANDISLSLGIETPANAATLDWVIAGGESGPKARPSHPDWFRAIRDQCGVAGVPFLFKQWGEWKSISEMSEAEYQPYYVSNCKAEPGHRQEDVDEMYGRRCTVETRMIRFDGESGPLGITLAESIGGHPAFMTFRVGKKAAGRLLDGVEHNGFPQVATVGA